MNEFLFENEVIWRTKGSTVWILFRRFHFSMLILRAWSTWFELFREWFSSRWTQKPCLLWKSFLNPISFLIMCQWLFCVWKKLFIIRAYRQRCVLWSMKKRSFDFIWFIDDMNPYQGCMVQCVEESDFYLNSFETFQDSDSHEVDFESFFPKIKHFTLSSRCHLFSLVLFMRQAIHSTQRTQNVNLPPQ